MLSADKIKRSVFFARTGIKSRVFAVPSLKLWGGRGIMLIADKIERIVFFSMASCIFYRHVRASSSPTNRCAPVKQ